MKRNTAEASNLPLLVVLLASPYITGCGDSTSSTSSSTDSNDTAGDESSDGGEPTGGDNLPINGNDCGSVLGWQTLCYQDGASILFSADNDITHAQHINNVVGSGAGSEFSPVCCEGMATQATADTACADRCQRLVCEAARSTHLDLAEGIEGAHYCTDHLSDNPSCGFDMDACLEGMWHSQTIQFLLTSVDYFMQATCNNPHNNQSSTFNYDVFDWNEIPTNNPNNDPPMCFVGTAETTPGSVVADDLAVNASGTTAAVTFTLGGSTYLEDSNDANLRFAYDLHDCPTHDRCINLAELHISLPTMIVQGLTIENAHLVVYKVDEQPTLQSSGTFSYAAGTLHAIVSASAAGMPIMLEGSNTATVTGSLTPGSDAMTVSGLSFDYSDSIIAAQLQIDIVGDYIVRGPTAVIVPTVVPRDCTGTVTFRAASSDPDSQTLTHLWWIPNIVAGLGSSLDVVLANGTHTIGLISQDSNGKLDASAIQYNRTCR